MSHSASKMLSYILFSTLLLCMIDSAFGHMEMKSPPPLRSKYNTNAPGAVDYDMTAPLATDGSNYPCKGYLKDVATGVPPVETYTAGQTYSMTVAGSASHMGGSCQLSLSYDSGKTFHVIHSMIGGCPLQDSYDFKIPSDAPSGKNVIFSWSWFNEVGNREMYQNCAVVDIVGGSGASYGLNTPEMFRANTQGGACVTPEGVDFVFPNPGDSVVYGGKYATQKPSGPTIAQGCANSPAPPPGNGNESTSPAATQPVQPTTQGGMKPTTVSDPVQTTPANVYPTTDLGSAPEPTTEPAPTTIVCDVQITTMRTTITQTVTSVAYVTLTRNNENTMTTVTRSQRPTTTEDVPVNTPSVEACDQPGSIRCYDNGKKWQFCDGHEYIDMEDCARGVTCQNGKLVNTY